jgi:beta-lactamase regulating signal transducer with metallopeptidase domain
MSQYLGWCGVVSAATLLVASLVDILGRHRSATFRHASWLAGLVPLLAAPAILARILLAGADPIPTTMTDGPSWTVAAPPSTARLSPLVLVWLAPALVLALRSLVGWILAARVAVRAQPLRSAAWAADAEASARALRLRNAPRLAVSEEVPGPAVAGAIRPVVLLPPGVLGAPPAFRRAILDQELAHVARRDVLVTRAWALARALHWYNPLAWWGARRLDLAAECACDDAVIRRGMPPREYADILVATLRGALPAGGLGAGFGSAPVVERIRALASRRRRDGLAGRERWMLAVAFAATLAPVAVAVALAARTLPRAEVIHLGAETRFTVKSEGEAVRVEGRRTER